MFIFPNKNMDAFLILIGGILIIGGIAGSVLPVLPGPLIGWFGLLLLHLSNTVPMNYYTLGITFVVAVAIFVLDYFIPAMGAKRFGGSKKGATGATVGLLIGLVAPIPLGFVLGAFVGAFIGELMHQHDDLRRALRSATGSFLGFLTSVGMKLLVSFVFLALYIYLLYDNWNF